MILLPLSFLGWIALWGIVGGVVLIILTERSDRKRRP